MDYFQEYEANSDLMLRDACPALYQALEKLLDQTGRPALIAQLNNLAIHRQALFGNPESFRFTVKRTPELTPEQYSSLELRDWETIEMLFQDGYVEVQLDQYGRMELIYLSKLPWVFEKLLKFHGYIVAPFAEIFPSDEGLS